MSSGQLRTHAPQKPLLTARVAASWTCAARLYYAIHRDLDRIVLVLPAVFNGEDVQCEYIRSSVIKLAERKRAWLLVRFVVVVRRGGCCCTAILLLCCDTRTGVVPCCRLRPSAARSTYGRAGADSIPQMIDRWIDRSNLTSSRPEVQYVLHQVFRLLPRFLFLLSDWQTQGRSGGGTVTVLHWNVMPCHAWRILDSSPSTSTSTRSIGSLAWQTNKEQSIKKPQGQGKDSNTYVLW